MASATANRPRLRSLAIGLVLLLIAAGTYRLVLRVPPSRWERAQSQVEAFPIDALDLHLSDSEDERLGARWRLLFGEDSVFLRTYDIPEQPDMSSLCEELRELGEDQDGESFAYQDLLGEQFPRCSISYRVPDLGDDYIRMSVSLRTTQQEGLRVLVRGARPHVL